MGAERRRINDFGYINPDGLKHQNEPARHKLMDLIGDIALIGRPLKGRIIATRPGHTINTTLAKKSATTSNATRSRLRSMILM